MEEENPLLGGGGLSFPSALILFVSTSWLELKKTGKTERERQNTTIMLKKEKENGGNLVDAARYAPER
jgi:hypothetical protein